MQQARLTFTISTKEIDFIGARVILGQTLHSMRWNSQCLTLLL